MTITFPSLPPTINHYYGSKGSKRFLTPDAKKWINATLPVIKAQARTQKELFSQPVAVDITFHHKTACKWDIDNRLKATFDILTRAGIISDDSIIDILTVERKRRTSNTTIINITQL